ncbi:hypothetical protein PVT67_11120 [Gallaecimonas kandeliae]|uniref:hypothetical protein n=1 Tax=Gallaecimonas kandeliae TaxID=3029055 RepID=UPI0026481C2A|nr:hypothetical protein [Gallaecimonas kandeliae]WKE64241.1 hypothetical protein PVT67_11120 [Gallaecimonas kandeliae]
MTLFNGLSTAQYNLFRSGELRQAPGGGLMGLLRLYKPALALGFQEKTWWLFVLLQWAALLLGVLLWLPALQLMPTDSWYRLQGNGGGQALALCWTFVCIWLAALPLSLAGAGMSAVLLLRRTQGQASASACWRLVLPRALQLWALHWLDVWLCVKLAASRLLAALGSAKAAQAREQQLAWKLALCGLPPALLNGTPLVRAGREAVFFASRHTEQLARLRAGYRSLSRWLGVLVFVAVLVLFHKQGLSPAANGKPYDAVLGVLFWAGLPLLAAVAFNLLLLKPVYVLGVSDLYYRHLEELGEETAE